VPKKELQTELVVPDFTDFKVTCLDLTWLS
jgi:hypothetical protein